MAPAISAQADALRSSLHPQCFACSPHHPHGLGLQFHSDANGTTHATWQPLPEFQSYNGRIHGGILATVIDASMVHALFAIGIAGVTAEMNLRYRAPVLLNPTITVSTSIEGRKLGLYQLRAELRQQGRLVVTATAKFMVIADPSLF